MLVEAGFSGEAAEIHSVLAQSHPESPAGPVGLAQAAMRSGAWLQALFRWDQLLARYPERPEPFWLAGRAATLAELGRSGEAGQILMVLVRDYPNNPAGWVGQAQLAMVQRDWARASTLWREVLMRFAASSGTASWETALASVLLELGQAEQAEGMLRALVLQHPGLHAPLWALVRTLFATGRPSEALATLEASPFRMISTPGLLRLRCECLIALRRLPEARTLCRDCLSTTTDLRMIELMLGIVAQLFEGRALAEQWLAMERRLDDLSALADAEAMGAIDALRARLNLALEDHDRFCDRVRALDGRQQGRTETMLRHVAAAMADRIYPDFERLKVFGIGLSKTGTTTLAAALTGLGLVTADYRNPLIMQLLSAADMHSFDAFTDIPAAVNFEKYYYLFPNAKFIYTTRALESWVVSVRHHWQRTAGTAEFASLKRLMATPDSFPYGRAFLAMSATLYFNHAGFAEAYRAHDARVRRFFQDKPASRFLEFDVAAGQGWPELCGFLCLAQPEMPFPWENRRPSAAEPII